MLDASSVVGIDVSKAFLDVAFGSVAHVRRFPNTPRGHHQLARAVGRYAAKRIVLEASGGYERRVLVHLTDQHLPVVRVNPRQVRDFARATGILAKTDAIDARVLVRFGAAVEPEHRPLPRPPGNAWPTCRHAGASSWDSGPPSSTASSRRPTPSSRERSGR